MYPVVFALLLHVCAVYSWPHASRCEVRARTETGWVCGTKRYADDRSIYASFRGIPYAKQPVGELRFKELEPAEPWDFDYDATKEGPVCVQTDVLYGRLMQPQGMSEECIHANIYVPLEALPTHSWRLSRDLEAPIQTATLGSEKNNATPKGLPILVFIHGGGFAFGSGDADLHGPEYMMSKNVIVITFNYRLNVFGFLSLNTEKVPGNAGLRDQLTLLRWVQRNARAFGGDPNEVTLAGQSAGAVSAHLLSLSKAGEGLFKRVILMSGTGTAGFYSPSPMYAQYLNKELLTILGISSTDPEEIHQQLIEMPTEKLCNANALLMNELGMVTFVPTVEAPISGITPVLDNDPEVLVAQGRGKSIPLLIGFTDAECETFRKGFEQFNIMDKIKGNPTILVPPKTLFTTPPAMLLELVKKVKSKYFNNTNSFDDFIHYCTEGYYQYPALKLAQDRARTGGAPVFLYEFSYLNDHSVIKEALGLNFTGAGHIEDMTYVFRANSVEGTQRVYPPTTFDDFMTLRMTNFVVNFMVNSKPINGQFWPQVEDNDRFIYQNIATPVMYQLQNLTENQKDMIDFFDNLNVNGDK